MWFDSALNGWGWTFGGRGLAYPPTVSLPSASIGQFIHRRVTVNLELGLWIQLLFLSFSLNRLTRTAAADFDNDIIFPRGTFGAIATTSTRFLVSHCYWNFPLIFSQFPGGDPPEPPLPRDPVRSPREDDEEEEDISSMNIDEYYMMLRLTTTR